jgi:hypothetical protein
LAAASLGFGQAFRTTSFNAKLKVNSDRTLTVDETVTIVPTGKPLNNLVVAEAPSGSHTIHFLVSRANLGNAATSAAQPVKVQDDQITTNLPATTGTTPVQFHINYSVLGAFSERSGGELGARSTMSWNLVPPSWPSAIESSLLEVEYPDKSVPVYVGANTVADGKTAAIEKHQDTAFSGKMDAFNVSEGSNGITMQPSSGIPANAGMHLLIAIPKKYLKPAPASLTVKPPPKPAASKPTTHDKAPVAAPVVASKPAAPKEANALLLILPLFPPVLFFFLYLKRFAFLRGRAFPSSAVPSGVGPAEAGYILEGSLKVRHVIGALSAIADGGQSKHGSATVSADSIGPVEMRALEIIKRRSSTTDPSQLRTFLSGSLQDLQSVVVHNLDLQDLLYPSEKRSKVVPAVSLTLALALAGFFAYRQDEMKGLLFTGLGVVLSALLVYSLSPLTQKGARVYQKVAGLDRFLSAHSTEFKAAEGADYLEYLRPYAIAFGAAKEE